MKARPINSRRRAFVKAGAMAATALALGSRVKAQESKPHLDENDPQAVQLGYKHDATKVDKKKFPTYKPGETCGNCQLFQGKPDKDEWAPCPIFSGQAGQRERLVLVVHQAHDVELRGTRGGAMAFFARSVLL